MKQLRDAPYIREAQLSGYPVGEEPEKNIRRILSGRSPAADTLEDKGGSGMGRHFVSYEAQCPFYRAEDRNIIYCEGVKDNSSIHNAFPGNAAAYKKEYCCGDWESCIIAKALWSKYD